MRNAFARTHLGGEAERRGEALPEEGEGAHDGEEQAIHVGPREEEARATN